MPCVVKLVSVFSICLCFIALHGILLICFLHLHVLSSTAGHEAALSNTRTQGPVDVM